MPTLRKFLAMISMNKAENLSELATAWTLSKNQVAAMDLHLAYEKKLMSIKRFLIEELRQYPNEPVRIITNSPFNVIPDEVALLLHLVNQSRLKRKLEPLSILW